MSSRKPQGKSGYLPTDYAEARKEGPTAADFTGGTQADLSIPALPPGEREDRNAVAVRGLRRRGAADLIDVLGLGEPPKHPASALIGVTSVPCPTCRAAAGIVCASKNGNGYRRGHDGRRRLAQELREAAA